jgi:DNA-binding response OmpR family regulator
MSEGRKTILIVENDQDIQDTLREFVEHMGHVALVADRASRGIKVIEGTPVDLLLLDIHMPGPHGHHMLTYLKNRNRRIPPTIVVSGYLDKELVPTLVRLGVSGIVAKPFNSQRLREEIDRVLGRASRGSRLCLRCGQPIQPGDQFCRGCGNEAALRQRCHRCDAEYEPEDRYCGGCGLKIELQRSFEAGVH